MENGIYVKPYMESCTTLGAGNCTQSVWLSQAALGAEGGGDSLAVPMTRQLRPPVRYGSRTLYAAPPDPPFAALSPRSKSFTMCSYSGGSELGASNAA